MSSRFLIIALFSISMIIAQISEEQVSQPSDTKPENPRPRIICPEQRFDFGYAPEGFYLVHNFIIRNDGNADLKIERVRTTCGCTSAPLKKMELKPGEETILTVIFNNSHYKSSASKGTIISSNDPIDPTIRVTFNAEMNLLGFPFKVSPFGLEIPQGTKDPKNLSFEIKNDTTKTYELKVLDWTAGVLNRPTLTKSKISKNETTRLDVTFDKDFDLASNFVKASITLETVGDNPIRFTIPIKGAGPE